MQLRLNLTFAIGDTVYLKVCNGKQPGMVTGVTVRPNGLVYYLVSWNEGEFGYFDFELTADYVPDYGPGANP